MRKYFSKVMLLGNLVEVLDLLNLVKFVSFVALAQVDVLED